MLAGNCQSRFNLLFGWALGALVAALAHFTGNSQEFPPELWEGVAVASGIRPPEHMFPLLWQNILSRFIGAFGISAVIGALKVLGPISLGLLSVMLFRIFNIVLPSSFAAGAARTAAGRWLAGIITAEGVIIFVCSEPVWLAGRVFSPEMFHLTLTLFAFLLVLTSVANSSVTGFILAGAVSGALASETLLAFLPPALGAFMVYRRSGNFDGEIPPPIANPIVLNVVLRWAALSFAVCWAAAAAVNMAFYRCSCAVSDGIFIAFCKYLSNYAKTATAAVSPLGVLLVGAVAVLPLTIISGKLKRLTDVEKFLPLPYVCFAVVTAIWSILQASGFDGCRFWDWEPGAVKSRYALSMCMLAFALMAVYSSVILSVDIFYRNNTRLIRETFPQALENEPLAVKVFSAYHRSLALLRRPARFLLAIVPAAVIPFRFDPAVREMSSVVNTIARQTAEECAGVGIIFTDGAYDAAVETIAAMEGRHLKALSMMSGGGKHETALRLRGETNEEFRVLLQSGSADAMRHWVRSGSGPASNIAVQVGTELWRKAALPMPAAGGFVARSAGYPDGAAEVWAERARSVIERVLDLCRRHDVSKAGYPQVRKLFSFGQWRLARMCRLRANGYSLGKDEKSAERELDLADRLDAANPEWADVRDRMLFDHWRGGVQLLPREGLKLALKRADFLMARTFAERILAGDPDDVQANFAMGMGCLIEKKYLRAGKYLEKCLARRPDEPAILNNLAVVELRLGRLDRAEEYALRALKLYPDSMEIKTTLRHIRSARTLKN